METIHWGSPPVGLFNFPLDLCAAQGGFSERRLDLRPNTHLTGSEYGAHIARGTYDMGHIGSPVFLPAAHGSREYAIVSVGICNYAPFYFVADAGIESLADCRGEPFVINKYKTCPHSLLKWHARQYGLSEADFEVITLMADSASDNYGLAFLEGIRAGRFRAGILYEPWVSLIERAFGWQVLADYPRIARPANYAFLLYARRSWIEHKPALVKKVVDAYFDCAQTAGGQSEALAAYAEKFSFIEPEDVRRAIRREAQHWQLHPGIDQSLLDRIEDEVIAQELVPREFRIADYVAPLN